MRKMNTKDLNLWIGSQIYRARIARKLSQEALAEAANVSRIFISQMENGRKSAKIDTYYRIACALDMSLCELFCKNEDLESLNGILLLLSDCSDAEIRAYIEVLRVMKIQFASLYK